jgi:hypothetical protein
VAVTWTTKVEDAFATQPMAASPTYTDTTAYVWLQEPISIRVGRQDEFGDVEPSTLSLRRNNSDGRFTQGLATSPYSPNVKLGRRHRVVVTRSAVGYRRFDGHADRWPTQWTLGNPAYATADFTATDRLKRYSQAGELRSMIEHEILRDTPTAYYPLGESDGATSAADASGNGQPAMEIIQVGTGGSVDFGSGTGPGTDGLSAPQFTPVDPANGKYLEAVPLSPRIDGQSFVLEAFVRCEPGHVSRMIVAITDEFPASTNDRLVLSIDGSGYLQAQLAVGGSTEYTIASDITSQKVNDGATHHVAIRDNWNGGSPVATLFFDGIAINSDISYNRPSSFAFARLLAGGNLGGSALNGTISHVAVTESALSDARIGVHADAGLNGMAGERSDQRIGRIADYVGIPTADRQFDVGDSLVGGQNISGRNPLEVMREVVATEQGVLFINPADGKLTFHNRSRRFNATVALTLTASQIGDDLTFPADDSTMVNDETVTSANGAGGRFFDQTSIDEYGLYVAANTADDAFQIAAWDVGINGAPRTRTPSVTVRIPRLEDIAPSLVPTILGLTIGSKIRLSSLPAQAPASSVDVFVEGWTEEITNVEWTITFNTSPADGWDVWQLNVAGHTELGVTTRLAP